MINSLDMDDVEARSEKRVKDMMAQFEQVWNEPVNRSQFAGVFESLFKGDMPPDVKKYIYGGTQNGKSRVR